jgi:hypothetical protein
MGVDAMNAARFLLIGVAGFIGSVSMSLMLQDAQAGRL